MAKTYTAQQMREEAKCFEVSGGSGTIPAMLRQAADLMEREEKREKKYEYAEKRSYGRVLPHHYNKIENVFIIYDDSTKVRREVGEWEEFEND